MYSGIEHIPKAANGQPTVLSTRASRGRCYNGFPIAHGGGVCVGLMMSVYLDIVLVTVQNDPLSVQTLLQVVRQVDVGHVVLTPYTCVDIVKSPSKQEIYDRVQFINYAGGKSTFLFPRCNCSNCLKVLFLLLSATRYPKTSTSSARTVKQKTILRLCICQ